MSIEMTRERFAEIAYALRALDDALAEIGDALPRSPERDGMFELEIPYDVPTELLAVTEMVREEYLAPAARALARASRIDDRRLEARFRRAHAALGCAAGEAAGRGPSQTPGNEPQTRPKRLA